MTARLIHIAAHRAPDAPVLFERSGLPALDERLSSENAGGLCFVDVPDRSAALAVERHLARRCNASGRVAVCVDVHMVDSCWCEIALRFGIANFSSDPSTAAGQLTTHAGGRVVVLLGTIVQGTWDHDVLQELAHAPSRLRCFMVRSDNLQTQQLGTSGDVVVVDPNSTTDAEAWWSGVLGEAASKLSHDNLGHLEAWWQRASRSTGNVPKPSIEDLDSEEQGLLARMHLVGRAWPKTSLRSLGSQQACDTLLARGLAELTQGFLRPAPGVQLGEPSHEDLLLAAQALDNSLATEPWAHARAGRLRAQAGDLPGAERSFLLALEAIENASLRRQVWQTWLDALLSADPEDRGAPALRGARTALDHDDIDIALRFAQAASAAPSVRAYDALFLTARAQLARGDLVAARVSLQRASACASTDGEHASVLAQLAEASYISGDLERAQSLASSALEKAETIDVRLFARNTLGKLLLARAAWDAAEEHFTADEHDATCAELELARVRARVNRAIALLSKGHAQGARTMLESVLAEAESRHDLRAVAFAMSNLAVLAMDRHDYAEALHLSERAIEVRRRVGDRVGLARVVANLAELRLRLGLVRQAEQVLAFGRQSLGASMPPTRVAHFALVAARLHLARCETMDAAREVAAALANAGGSSDGDMVGECHRVATRIALEDGDVPRAAQEVREASSRAASPFAHAEVALLQASIAQARGDDAAGLADAALLLARQAGDDDLLRECHVLCAELARFACDLPTARRHLDAAERLRTQIAEKLPIALQAPYLARRAFQSLPALRASLEHAQSNELSPADSPASSMRSAVGEAPFGFVGNHPSVQRLLAAVAKVAPARAPVLVCGESGTGKELVAEALHRLSDRRAGPLVKVNCAALVETLLLSELFGHEKGAFTGAAGRRRGRFEMADGGTLFLDEIGDISARTQVALLRVLQDQTFERVGGSTTLRADVRVVCATNKDLKALVAQGAFREDLYYRLCGVTLEIPALRTRADDIPRIAEYLLRVVARERNETVKFLPPSTLQVLRRYPWPGNVRELDNVLRAASLFCDGDEVGPNAVAEHFQHTAGILQASNDSMDTESPPAGPIPVADTSPSGLATHPSAAAYSEIRNRGASLGDLKRQIERDCIERALAETSGNITHAATLLGMKRPRLSQLVKQYGLLESTSEEL